MSPGRIAATRSFADMSKKVVARCVPQRVVDQLELVEVEEQHADLRSASPCTRQAVDERSVRRARLGRPVSESCNAWWASSLSICLRSVMSWSCMKKYSRLGSISSRTSVTCADAHTDAAIRAQIPPFVRVGVVTRLSPASMAWPSGTSSGCVNSVQRRPISSSPRSARRTVRTWPGSRAVGRP